MLNNFTPVNLDFTPATRRRVRAAPRPRSEVHKVHGRENGAGTAVAIAETFYIFGPHLSLNGALKIIPLFRFDSHFIIVYFDGIHNKRRLRRPCNQRPKI
jgi:hypothetical protein